MKKFYFTFGQDHWTREGYPMKNNWVMVKAEDYNAARLIFVERFTSLYMQTDMTFSMHYDENEWTPDVEAYFPLGEYKSFEQEAIGTFNAKDTSK